MPTLNSITRLGVSLLPEKLVSSRSITVKVQKWEKYFTGFADFLGSTVIHDVIHCCQLYNPCRPRTKVNKTQEFNKL